MKQSAITLAAAATLAFGAFSFVGCEPISGGGSTDTYGNTSYDRYRVGGNVGTGSGAVDQNTGTPATGTIDQTSGNLYGGKDIGTTAAGNGNLTGSGAGTAAGQNTIGNNSADRTNVPTTQPVAPGTIGGPNGIGGGGKVGP